MPSSRPRRVGAVLALVAVALVGPVTSPDTAGATSYGTARSEAATGSPGFGVRVPWETPVGGGRPLTEVVLRAFEAPAHRYAAGHRGVDLRADPGAVVTSPTGGVVAFAGQVAGRPIVSVLHDDGHRSSLLPVVATAAVGTRVDAGSPVGRVGGVTGSGPAPHCPVSCVHWGVRLQGAYVDPLRLVSPPVRLLPRHVVAARGDGTRTSARRGQLAAELHDGLSVHLADARLGDSQHLADLGERQPFVVVQRDHDLLALRELVDGP